MFSLNNGYLCASPLFPNNFVLERHSTDSITQYLLYQETDLGFQSI